MKNKPEIEAKITYYQGMLAGVQTAKDINHPEVFLEASEHAPAAAIESLRVSGAYDEFIRGLPPEDQECYKHFFEIQRIYLRLVLEQRLTILKWVLED